jgi:hypothetical protein
MVLAMKIGKRGRRGKRGKIGSCPLLKLYLSKICHNWSESATNSKK